MKTLILFRHGKSSWKDADLKDFDRPLKKRGRKDAARMGELLKSLRIHPDIILTSPAERTAATARLVAEELGCEEDKILEVPELYLESESHLLDQVKSINDAYDTAFLVGHNPGLTDLANKLTGDSVDNIPTSGAYGIRFEISSWKEIEPGQGTKAWFERPSDLRRNREHKKHGDKKREDNTLEHEDKPEEVVHDAVHAEKE